MKALGGQMPDAEYLGTERDVQEFLEYSDHCDVVAIDTETDGKDYSWKDKVLLMSLACGERRVCLPGVLIPILKPLLTGPKLKELANAKFDLHRCANIGVEIADPIFDVIVASMRENSARPHHDLKFLSCDGLFERHDPRFNQYGDFGTTFGKGKKIDNAVELLSPDNRGKATNYATQDSWNTLVVGEELRSRLAAIPNPLVGTMLDLYYRIEVPMTRILYEYERMGMLVDENRLNEHAVPLHRKIDELSRKASVKAHTAVNLRSPNQLVALFIDTLNYPVIKQTDGGKSGVRRASVDEEVLKTWKKMEGTDKEMLDIALESRSVVNQIGALKEIGRWRDPYGRVHSNINQSGAETGRLSSSRPALQNKEKQFRDVFIPPNGWDCIVFDLKQVEMCIAASLSGDKKMIQMLRDGLDVHSMTVSLLEGIPYRDVNEAHEAKKRTKRQQELEDERSDKKHAGFGLLYGETKWKLITQLRKLPSTNPDEEARREENLEYAEGLQHKWLDQFEGVKVFIENTKAFASHHGYVSTLLGWRRQLPAAKLDFNVPEWKLMQQMRSKDWNEAMRQAVNAEIQGTAADLMKLIQIRVWRDEYLRNIPFQALLPVHDELVSHADKRYSQEVLRRCLMLAKNPQEDFGIHLPVDILADGGIGPNWKAAKG